LLKSHQERLESHWRQIVKTIPLRHGPWRYSRTLRGNEPVQGWKVHLSATLRSASRVFSLARPILRRHDVLFKVPNRLELLAALNSGFVGFSQIGKFLTAYSRSDAEAVALARELHAATRKLEGPHIPFDVRYRKKSIVYYRYGAFLNLGEKDGAGTIVDSAGRIRPDVRDRAHAVPRWRDDPFQPGGVRSHNARLPHPFGPDLLPIKAMMQRGKGAVYKALDLSVLPARFVIVKEGRRHGESNWLGVDGFAQIKHEGRVLRQLERVGVAVPAVLREFTRGQSRYLVLEMFRGRPLLARNGSQPGKSSWRRSLILLDRIGSALAAIHRAGYVWRDCKPEHIYFQGRQIRLVDFEGACRIEQTDVHPWGSPNYIPPSCRIGISRRPGTLEDDYALGVIAFQFGTGKFPPASVRSRAVLYNRTHCPNPLREKIERLLDSKI
jgi:hypothetical protein